MCIFCTNPGDDPYIQLWGTADAVVSLNVILSQKSAGGHLPYAYTEERKFMIKNDKNNSQLTIYQTETGETKIDVRFQNETV